MKIPFRILFLAMGAGLCLSDGGSVSTWASEVYDSQGTDSAFCTQSESNRSAAESLLSAAESTLPSRSDLGSGNIQKCQTALQKAQEGETVTVFICRIIELGLDITEDCRKTTLDKKASGLTLIALSAKYNSLSSQVVTRKVKLSGIRDFYDRSLATAISERSRRVLAVKTRSALKNRVSSKFGLYGMVIGLASVVLSEYDNQPVINTGDFSQKAKKPQIYDHSSESQPIDSQSSTATPIDIQQPIDVPSGTQITADQSSGRQSTDDRSIVDHRLNVHQGSERSSADQTSEIIELWGTANLEKITELKKTRTLEPLKELETILEKTKDHSLQKPSFSNVYRRQYYYLRLE